MKDYKIHIDEGLEIKTKKILNDYWLIQNNNFLYKATEITKMHDITQGDLTKLVKKNSYCEVLHGNCRECNEVMREKTTSKSEYISSIRDKSHTCSQCRAKFRRMIAKHEIDESEKKRKKSLLNFENAVIEKKWIGLSKDELEILYNLIENKTKSKIYANVFEGKYSDKRVWNYVNKFQNLGLINVIRNGFSVVEFEFDDRINEAIRNLLHIKSGANIDDEPVLDYLSFSLIKKENKETIRQPDYGGTFILQRDVILRANVKYIYGGWIQIDGSINLKFTPSSNLQTNKVIQKNIETEPELVGEIIKSMFNDMRNDTPIQLTHEQFFGTGQSNPDENDDYDVPF